MSKTKTQFDEDEAVKTDTNAPTAALTIYQYATRETHTFLAREGTTVEINGFGIVRVTTDPGMVELYRNGVRLLGLAENHHGRAGTGA